MTTTGTNLQKGYSQCPGLRIPLLVAVDKATVTSHLILEHGDEIRSDASEGEHPAAPRLPKTVEV